MEEINELKNLENEIKNWLFNHKLYIDHTEKLMNMPKYGKYIIKWENAYAKAKKTNPELNYDFGDMISFY